MLQAAYVTKRSFAASDSATVAGRVLPAREPSGSNKTREDFCAPCLDRHSKLVPVSPQGKVVGMCDECFSGTESQGHRQVVAKRFQELAERAAEGKERSRRHRIEVMAEEAAPYFVVANSHSCSVCGRGKPRGGSYCGNCKSARANLLRIKSWLRCYQRTKSAKQLSNAMGLIRLYSIRPEDLKFV